MMIAVIKTGGKQYAVREQQNIRVEKLPADMRKDNRVVFTDVLLVSDSNGKTTVGTPRVEAARVEARVLRDGRDRKIRVVKYKPKTRYKRVAGHRQPFTEVRIEKIVV